MVKKTLDLFLSDKKEEIGDLFSVKCGFVRFSNYEILTLPNLKYKIGDKECARENVDIIAGVLPIVKNKNPAFIEGMPLDCTHEVTFQKNILFEVLDITRKIDVTKKFCKQMLEAIPTVEIINLFKKYGMHITTSNPIRKQHRITGVELSKFKYRLFALRWRLSVYMAIYNGDYDLMCKQVPTIDLLKIKKGKKEIITAAKEHFAQLSPGTSSIINMSLQPNKSGFGLEFYASDIIETCHIFLSFMSVMGDAKNLKKCECGRLFTGHGNSKYCPNCNRKTIWSRKNRSKRKEVLK